MKNFAVSLLGLLVSTATFAATDWNSVRANPKVASISQSAYAQTFGSDGFFNACLEGNNFRTIQPLSYCAETRTENLGQESGGSVDTCIRPATRHVTLSRTQVETHCTRYVSGGQESGYYDCAPGAEVSTTVTLPTTMMFNVYGYTGWTNGGGQESGGLIRETALMFSAPFTVPACR